MSFLKLISRRFKGGNKTPIMNPMIKVRAFGPVEMFQREWLGELHAFGVPGICSGFSVLFGCIYALRVFIRHPQTTPARVMPVDLQTLLDMKQGAPWTHMNEGKEDDVEKTQNYHMFFGRTFGPGQASVCLLEVLDVEAKKRGYSGVDMSASTDSTLAVNVAAALEAKVCKSVCK